MQITPFNSNFKIYLVNLLIIISLSSCYNKTDKKKYKIFRFNVNEGLTSLDPAFSKNQVNIWGTMQLFNGLVELNNQMEIVPCVAKRIFFDSLNLSYTFTLRNDVYFHDNESFTNSEGRKVNAYDFEYSFKRIIDSTTASPGAWIFNDKVLRNKSNNTISDTCFKALNDSIFRIYLEKPFPAFLQLLAMPYGFVVPKEAIEKYGKDFRIHPVGTGPFTFKLWEESNALILNRNEKYFKKDSAGNTLPYLDIVHVSFINDRNIAFMTFRQKKLEMISGLDENSRDIIFNFDGSIKKDFASKFIVQKIPYLNTEYFAFLVDSSLYDDKNHPLLNKNFRKALNYGFNREQMVQFILNKVGQPANQGMVPPYLYKNTTFSGFNYDPQKAVECLKKSNYKNYKKPIKINTIARFPYKETAEFLQREWAKIGIKVEIEINTFPNHLELASNGKIQIMRASWLGDYPDPENYLTLFYGKNSAPNGPNRARYKNKKYDLLYEKALMTHNSTERTKIYVEMEKILLEDSPMLPLFYDEVVRLTQKNIVGLEANPMNGLILEKVDIK